MRGQWVPHDTRDQLSDVVRRWRDRTEIATERFIHGLGLGASKFYDWRARSGRVNEHHGRGPRDFRWEALEKRALVEFHDRVPLEGDRRLTFMMLDAKVVAVSPANGWRVLHQAGRLARWKSQLSGKGKGFPQPLGPHQPWHVDISYVNLAGTFDYLCSMLDGYRRSLGHGEIREPLTEAEVEIILPRAPELFPQARPRLISDNVLN